MQIQPAMRTHPMISRCLDLLVAGALLVVTLPVILVVAVGSAIVLRTWPFFVQDRVGHGGRSFRFLKIRTLPRSTPTYLLKDELTFDDVPLFARTLRRLHLDELPQLALVLLGKMSMVGPRPEMIHFHEHHGAEFAVERTSVRPGCTGLWQIGASRDDLIGAAPEYDRFYLEHHNPRLDLWILWRTGLLMLGLRGRVTLDDVPLWAVPGPEPVVATPSLATRELDFAEVD